MWHLNLPFDVGSTRAAAVLCPSLAKEERNVRKADVEVNTFKITTINS